MSAAIADFHEVELDSEQIGPLVDEIDAQALAEKYLWDGRVFMRRNAALAVRLGVKLEPDKAGLLGVAAKDTDEVVREHVVGALAEADTTLELALEILFSALADPVETVRDTAVESLDRLVERGDEDLVPLLVSALGGPRSLIRMTAARMLLRLGEPVVGPLITALRHDNDEVRKEAFNTLARLGTRAAPGLIEALPESGGLLPHIVKLLCQLPGLEDDQRSALSELLGHDDEEVVNAAEKALKEAGSAKGPREPMPIEVDVDGFTEGRLDEEALDGADIELDVLAQAMNDARWFVRANAIDVLAQGIAKLDEDDGPRLIMGLAALMRDEAPAVREAAATALGKSGHSAAIAPLIGAVTDRAESVQARVEAGLLALANDLPAEMLHALTPDDPEVCHAATISAVAEQGKGAAAAVAEVLAEADRPVQRISAARALGAMAEGAAKVVDGLRSALGDESALVRAAAADAIGFVGENSEELMGALKEALQDTHPEVRHAVSRTIARLKGEPLPGEAPPEPEPIDVEGFDEGVLDDKALAAAAKELEVPRLLACLTASNDAVRTNAAGVLAVLAPKEDEDVQSEILFGLASLIRDGVAAVRVHAIKGLGGIGGGGAVSPLLVALEDHEPEVLEAAEDGIKALASAAPEALLADIGPDTPVFVQDAVIDALVAADVSDAVAEALTEAESVPTKVAALSALERAGGAAKKSVGVLLNALRDSNEVVRRAAAAALGAVVESPEEGVDAALQAARSDGDPLVRLAVFTALARIKGDPLPGEQRAAPEPIEVEGFHDTELSAADLKSAAKEIGADRLAIALSDGRPQTRTNAAGALATMASKASDAATALAVSLRDSAASVRAGAAKALGAIGEDAGVDAIQALVFAADDPDESVGEAVAAALDELGADALPALVAALDADPTRVARCALPALTALGDSIVEPLTEALEHVSVLVRCNAVAALGALGPDHSDATRDVVVGAASDENELVRKTARDALDCIDGVEPAPLFLEEQPLPTDGFASSPMDDAAAKKAAKGADLDRLQALLFDGRSAARENAARTFAHVGKSAEDYVPSLLLALKDANQDVRIAAATTLGAVCSDPDQVVPSLAAMLPKADEELHEAALSSIEAYGKKAVEPLMVLLPFRPDWVVKCIAPVAKRMGKDVIRGVTDQAVSSTLLNARVNALDVLAAVGDDAVGAEKDVVALLEDWEVLVRAKAVRALGSIGKPSAKLVETIEALCDADESPTVRSACKLALQYIKARS